MTESSPARDWRDTVFLPKTDFPMKAGLPQKEPQILGRWESSDLYGRLRAARTGREKFILHDGPPYANGDIHIGHALNHILKDMVIRTQTLLGKDAPYVPGWDCHGLPIEWKVEEQYRKAKKNKDEVPPEEFRAECRAYAAHWVAVQKEQLKRLGQMGAWDRPYLTMDYDSEATIVGELLKFAESGQLYRGAKPVMWSPVEKTALAEAEVEYEEIVSTQVDVAFEIVEAPNCRELEGAYAVIWTTTPWTIPVNQAIAYASGIQYALLTLTFDITPSNDPDRLNEPQIHSHNFEKWRGQNFLVADDELIIEKFWSRLRSSLGDASGRIVYGIKKVGTVPAGNLKNARYVHPMFERGEWFSNRRPFLRGKFVTTESGTGLVHMAPDHGEDDFALCKAHGLEPVFAVEGDGRYRADWAWLGGEGSVINPKFNAPDGPICSDLRASGALLAASADYRHSYPHSWRSKAKVIYRCTPQWFVPMDAPIGTQNTVRAEPVDAPSRSVPDEGSAALRQAQGERSKGDTQIDEAPGEPVAGDTPPFASSEVEKPQTLRQRALAEIERVRFVPEKGRNRIGAMVAGRPDWVLSRQRAWGVPITLFVDRRTGQYLNDPAVNARIVDAVRAGGVDAWSDANAAHFLGEGRDPADYERVTDILDVWFDSGSTHVFTLESGKWPEMRWPADLYLEGSDQHRGWFQSSLLESCATRGRAPYDAVLTHGFTMDQSGRKMSKSLGNTISPADLMRDYGADIIRLWALSVDFTEDHRIGKEILAGVADQYRKLRNSFRYMLGALGDFDESERVPVAEMPELERYMLSRLAALDATLRGAVDAFDFNAYVRALTDFANEDLSAFFFDIRKDVLYCDVGPACRQGTATRRAYRTVLDTLFHALVRYAAPVLVFTAEEVWGARFPDGDSVHLLEWPQIGQGSLVDEPSRFSDPAHMNVTLGAEWAAIRQVREAVSSEIEPLRKDKVIRSSLEAVVELPAEMMLRSPDELAELFIVASVTQGQSATVTRTRHHKCGRCWRHLPDVAEDAALCGRCAAMVGEGA